MNINLIIPAVMSMESIAQRISVLESPAVILDNSLRVVAKNKLASSVFNNLRQGRRFDSFIDLNDISIVKNMEQKQIAHVNLADGKHKALVICGRNYWLFVITKAFFHAHDGVLRLYGNSSGYDVNIMQPYELQPPYVNSEKIDKITERISCCDVLSSCDTIFDAAEVFHRFCLEMKNRSSEFDKRFNISFTKERMAILGAEKDFSLILAYLTRFCMENSLNALPEIRLFRSENEVILKIICECDMLDEISKENIGGFKNTDTEEKYWFYLIKLLADGNLWDFSVKSLTNGQTEFLLKANHVAVREKYVLRDISKEHIRKIIDFVFGEKAV